MNHSGTTETGSSGVKASMNQFVPEAYSGLADHLIAQIGFANGAKEIITFDKANSKAPDVRPLK